jgi:hypothetical protein
MFRNLVRFRVGFHCEEDVPEDARKQEVTAWILIAVLGSISIIGLYLLWLSHDVFTPTLTLTQETRNPLAAGLQGKPQRVPLIDSFGASPASSALDHSARRDPAERVQP